MGDLATQNPHQAIAHEIATEKAEAGVAPARPIPACGTDGGSTCGEKNARFGAVFGRVVVFALFGHVSCVCRFAHRLLDEAEQAFLPVLHEGFERIIAQQGGVDQMAIEVIVQLVGCDLVMRLGARAGGPASSPRCGRSARRTGPRPTPRA